MEATTGSVEERLHKLADPGRRQGLKDRLPAVATAPLETVTVLSPRSPSTEPFREMSVRQVAELTGKHPVDAMLDIAVEDGLRTLFYAAPPQGTSDLLREIVQYPHMLFGVSDGGAHTKFLTAGRYPTETLAQQVRDNDWITYEEAHRRLSALPAQLAGFRDRGRAAGRRAGRRRRVRRRAPRGRAERGRGGPPRRRVAADPARVRVPRGVRQRRAHDRRRRRDRASTPVSSSATAAHLRTS